MNNNKLFFAEVIESSLHTWLAQSWRWNEFPDFGSLIVITDATRKSFGIVSQIQTGSMDPSRYPFPYQKTEEELLREQPQIFEFLRTSFRCLSIGYQDNATPEKIYYQLAPHPPKIHTFVRRATAEEHQAFFKSEKYLHLLFHFAHQVINLDELLLALLKTRSTHATLTHDDMQSFIETFSLLTGNDYRRLKLFLQRAATLMPNTD